MEVSTLSVLMSDEARPCFLQPARPKMGQVHISPQEYVQQHAPRDILPRRLHALLLALGTWRSAALFPPQLHSAIDHGARVLPKQVSQSFDAASMPLTLLLALRPACKPPFKSTSITQM